MPAAAASARTNPLRVIVLLILILAAIGLLPLPAAQYRAWHSWRTGSAQHVLFIGNSFTNANDLPWMVEALSGGKVVCTGETRNGYTLIGHWQAGTAQAQIAARAWNWVVLQDQSRMAQEAPAGLHQGLAAFVPLIVRDHARPMLFMTWADRNRQAEQQIIAQAYQANAAEMGATVAPVGLVFARILRERPSLPLYAADGHHPSPLGTYAAASVFTALFTGDLNLEFPAELEARPEYFWQLIFPPRIAPADPGTLAYIRRAVRETLVGKP